MLNNTFLFFLLYSLYIRGANKSVCKDNCQYFSMKETSLYIHIPYCRSKCIYCDFYSGGERIAQWPRLLDALCCEMQLRKNELSVPPSSIYIGGGTPSLMPVRILKSLVGKIKEIFGCEGMIEEFTIEVNPDDVTENSCEAWKDCGVTRVSMGVQSFHDNELSCIGRRHNSDCALKGFGILKNVFNNISIDLMFGLPNQSMESWKSTVETALSLAPSHISAYSLMFEEGTALTVLKNERRLLLPSEEDCIEMWNYLSERLAKAGYRQYEISNYSLPGMESLHNSRYWDGSPYLGIGPSAHSYDGARTRRFNPPDINGYLNCYSPFTDDQVCTDEEAYGSKKFYNEEFLSDEELLEEMILTRMRTRNGIKLAEVEAQFGKDASERIMRNAAKHLLSGVLEEHKGSIALTKKGVMICDDIILDLAL